MYITVPRVCHIVQLICTALEEPGSGSTLSGLTNGWEPVRVGDGDPHS